MCEFKTLGFSKKVFFFLYSVVSFINLSYIETIWGPSVNIPHDEVPNITHDRDLSALRQ